MNTHRFLKLEGIRGHQLRARLSLSGTVCPRWPNPALTMVTGIWPKPKLWWGFPGCCIPSQGMLLRWPFLASNFETKQEDKSQPRPLIFGTWHSATTGLWQLQSRRDTLTERPHSIVMLTCPHFPKPRAYTFSPGSSTAPAPPAHAARGAGRVVGSSEGVLISLPEEQESMLPVRDSSHSLFPATMETLM